MSRAKEKKKSSVVYVVPPSEIKEDFLDICHALDMDQVDAFAQIVRFYYEEMAVKPRPSRLRK